jgi:hypothetical protein
MHNLVVSFLAVTYLAANVYAIVKVGGFEVARSRKHLILYGVPFILWGSVILLGCWLMEIMRRFDEWAPAARTRVDNVLRFSANSFGALSAQ